jgi:signal transduction histidine kinase
MAHEINNPLEAVMNALFLMSCDGALGSETRASLELAQRELDRVAHMTKQTLGFYREHARPATVHLPAIVDELAGLYARKLGYKRISLKRAYGGAGQVDGVAGELRQIVSNLMANSIDAVSPQGTIYVRIADFRQKHYGIRLTIADDGSGIGQSDLSSIFEPFFTTKKEVGTGLGLWVTRQIVEKHGGSIRVRSKTGKGSVFSVYLPLHQEPGTATTTSQGHAASR